jgi:1-acyl-sn-glycerol-3-phosphate acyltransferase
MIATVRYHFFRWLARTTWRLFGGIDVRGVENIPRTGPFLLFANHESFLDPLLLQGVCPRVVHTMAKSTQFSSPIFRKLLVWLYGFPVRRFEVDPQAVRQALRRLNAGHPVLIYIEGERSWDGKLQPLRRGTVRLALKAGVPIITARIDGTYDAWPRWDRRIKRRRVRIEFRKPFQLPQVNSRAQREQRVSEAAAQIEKALQPSI